ADGADRLLHDAGALFALEEQPLRRDSLRRHHALHQRHLRRRPPGDAQHRRFLDVVHGQPRSSLRRHLPPPATLRDASGRLLHRLARPDGGVAVRARTTRSRSRGGGMSANGMTGNGANGNIIVAAQQLSKWYGQVIGLNDVSVTVPAGITGLLGPNGARKSTFLKLITGQLKPSKGRIQVRGEPIWD